MNTLIINKNDLRHNINIIKELAKTTNGCKKEEDYTIIGVVKGNGYGLGLKEYSEFLIDNGIEILATATVEEAISLRNINKQVEILNMSSTAIKEEIEELAKNNITITIGSKESTKIVNELAKKGTKIKAHIKIDTGFGRYGFLYSNVNTVIKTIKELDENVEIEGIFTHFSLAYYKNSKSTIKQFNAFMTVLEALEKENINIKLKHVCNSPAFINFPEMRLNCARIGSAFLGRIDTENVGLKKIGMLKSEVAEIKTLPKDFNVGYLDTYKTKKETKVAIIPIGYMDGYNMGTKADMFRTVDKLRNLKHQIHNLFTKQNLKILVNNKYYNVIGKIGMYHITIDITGSNVNIGDEVTLSASPAFVNSTVRREYI